MFRRMMLVVGLWTVGMLPAAAQEMPDWAAPLEPQDTPSAPALPDDPPIYDEDSVPVDGGLALLALAGAGYAVHRRRRRR